jgi:hypothetical protein
MKGHRVCDRDFAGCWNHEQTRTCIYVHPDEPQWADACSGALCYDRQAQAFHLRGAAPPQTNRFVAVARQEERTRVPRRDDLCMRQERVAHYARDFAAGGGHQGDGWEQAGKRARK